MKKFLGLVLVLTILIGALTLTGCGEKTNNGGTVTNGGNSNNSDEVSWPNNEYTKLIPKPEEAVIYSEKAIDNVYFLGHNITLEDWTIEECKVYAEKLKDAGFTEPGAGASDVVVTDTDSMYSFGAKNSDGVYVTVGAYSGNNSGSISIQVTKDDE